MVIKNRTTNVSFGPRHYAAPGSNGETYDVIHEHDDMWTCTCAYFEKRIRHPVADLKYGCKHMRNAANGDYGKPRVRASVRLRPTVRRVTVSDEMRDLSDSLSV